jgi:acyl carrier protein
MVPAQAMLALADALDDDEGTLTVADVDWARFAPSFAAARPRPLLAELPEAQQALASEAATDTNRELTARLRALPDHERRRHLLALVLAETAALLGHRDASQLDPDTGFFDLGLDSLMAIDLRRRLLRVTGLRLPSTLAFDYPKPSALARRLADELCAEPPPTPTSIAGELDRLDAALSAIPTGNGARADIARRLQALQARWTEIPATPDPDLVDRIGSADADELFAMIERAEQERSGTSV